MYLSCVDGAASPLTAECALDSRPHLPALHAEVKLQQQEPSPNPPNYVFKWLYQYKWRSEERAVDEHEGMKFELPLE